jgi:hypothetical protein
LYDSRAKHAAFEGLRAPPESHINAVHHTCRISHFAFGTMLSTSTMPSNSMMPATLLRLISLLPITAILVAVVLTHREPATERAMR